MSSTLVNSADLACEEMEVNNYEDNLDSVESCAIASPEVTESANSIAPSPSKKNKNKRRRRKNRNYIKSLTNDERNVNFYNGNVDAEEKPIEVEESVQPMEVEPHKDDSESSSTQLEENPRVNNNSRNTHDTEDNFEKYANNSYEEVVQLAKSERKVLIVFTYTNEAHVKIYLR